MGADMGADMTKNKDSYIDIVIDVSNKVVVAGEYIQGTVHINCKDKREYKSLMVRLESIQEIQWKERQRHRRRTVMVTFRDYRKTYTDAFELAKFSNKIIGGGHYSFPFKFLLPSGFPGSIYQDKDNYIRYPLIAELIPSSSLQDDIQKCCTFLTVLQPVRAPFGQITKNQRCSPKCCNCLMDYGTVNVSLSCDKNFVRSGENISVACYIDNSAGKTEIKDVRIVIRDLQLKATNMRRKKNTFSETNIGMSSKVVLPGQKQTINFNAKIPGSNILACSTAIGQIFSRCILLQLETSMGCCSNNPKAFVHLVYHSINPILQKCDPMSQSPVGWNPIVTNEVVFSNMKQYQYKPNASIRIKNRENSNENGNMSMMMDQSSMGMRGMGGGMGGGMQMEMNQQQPIMNQNIMMSMGTQGDMNPNYNANVDFNNINMGSQNNIMMSKQNQQQVQGQKGYTSKYRSRESQYRDNK